MTDERTNIVQPGDALVIEPGTTFTVTIPVPDPTPIERHLRGALADAQDEISRLREQIARRGFYPRPGEIRVVGGPARPTAGAAYRILEVMDVTGDHELVEVRVALP
ncbi:MAG: hypothetical protein KGL39_59905 [Patescibacteria group bacterium]|nr:hypothetical protein [Patescibacteria group bacterium]